MERAEPLFSKYDVHSSVRNTPEELKTAIEDLSDKELFEVDQGKLLEQLVAKHRIDVPVLNVDAVTPVQKEVDVDVSGDPRRFIDDRNRPFYIKATEISFRVPFKGDADVFRCRPTTRSLNPPRADIETDSVVIRIVREDHNAAEYRKQFDQTVHEIQGALNQLHSDFSGLEETLRQTATAHLAKRREKRQKDRGLIDGLGFGKPKA